MHEQIILTDPPKRIIPIYEPQVIGPDLVEFGKFSNRQRDWLLRRDTDPATGLVRCQFWGHNRKGEWVQCPNDEKKLGGTSDLHAHHITAQGFWEIWFDRQMGDEGESPHQPWNGIILCIIHHTRDKKAIHPDYHEALTRYRKGNKEAFAQVARQHGELEHAGIPYWDTSYDQLLYDIARDRTEAYLATHPNDPWPER